MKLKFIFSVLFLFALAQFSFAQCGSHKKAKVVKTSWSNGHQDIIDIATSSENFGTLVAAVKTAGLVETLQGEGPFTVFAPVNSAFAKLPEGTVESLLLPENKELLTKVLTYHVVAGEFMAKDVINAINASNGQFKIKTVNGGTLTATLSNGSVLLTDENGGIAAVTQTDVDATNGVIHVIDSVVLPK